MSAAPGFDLVYWEYDVNGDLMPRETVIPTPNMPVITSVVAGDGQVIVSLTTDVQTNDLYLRYREINETEWSAESIALSRTGDGDITITGLVNGYTYMVTAYAKTFITSGWTAPEYFMPTDGVVVTGANPNWARWIFASVSKHFDDRKGDYELFIEGQYRNVNPPKDFFELRMDGPYITEQNKGYFQVYVEINVLVQSHMDDTNYHRIHETTGYVSSIYTGIKLYKFGNGPLDTQEEFGCLRLLQNTQKRNRIEINQFGQIDPKVRLMQASIEGHFEEILSVN